MQVNTIQRDSNTYCSEPEDKVEYDEWRLGFFDLGILIEGSHEVVNDFIYVFRHRNTGQSIGLIKFLMDQRHGMHPVLTLPNSRQRCLIFKIGGLWMEQAGNNLQVVFDPVMDLPKHPFPFP